MRTLRSLRAVLALACLTPVLALAGPVDINTADAGTLAKELKGIGMARAQAIIAYREQNGPFKNADDLTLVKGIGQKVVDENRESIRVGGQKSAPGGAKPAGASPASAR